ncbi:MAG: TonB-dependent receptor [Undibacterium sp.]|nr:TonB-dependent receptor [Opitutaceae bacterium]
MNPAHPATLHRRLFLRSALTACSVLTLWLFATGSLRAQAQVATGTIEGRVFNAASGNALVNARVILEGTAREVITDEGGSYRFAAVPAGPTQLSVVYVGMEHQVATISVPAGGLVQREFELVLTSSAHARAVNPSAIKLDKFSVVEDRAMSAQAIAMNEQRNAPNIKNVVAIDEFGDRGNENIGEFLLFLPGVSIATSGSEPTTVSLRGFPGNNTGLTVDGGETAGSFNGNSRALDLREVPMNNVSRVEVTKVPTPDMPASGLGGSINLITRSGFEARKPKLSFNAYTMFHDRNGFTFDGGPRTADSSTSPKYVEPSFDFNYLHPINKNLAITVGGSRTWRAKPPETGTKDTDESATWDLVRLVQTTSQWQSLAQIFKTLQGQIGIDYRLSSTDSLSVSAQYRKYDLPITRSVLGFAYGAGATGNESFSQGAATGVGTVTMNGSGENVEPITQTKNYTLRYRHRGDIWRADAGGYYSTSASNRPDIDNGYFNTTPSTIANVIIRGENLQKDSGIIPTSYSAIDHAGQAVDVYDGANYAINSGNTNQVDWNTQKYNLRGDLSRDFEGPVPFTLKVGTSFDTMHNDQRRYPRTWSFRPNGATDATSRLAGKFNVFDEGFNADGPTVYARKVRWISGTKLFDLFQQQPAWFVSDEPTAWQGYVTNSRSITERISAAYVRADVRLLNNRLWVVAGVRFEHTADIGAGPLDDINAQYQRNPDGTFVRNAAGARVFLPGDALALRKLRYRERGARSDRTYSGYYPSVNASYNMTENLVLRAAYAKTIGRPNLNFIVPGTTVSDPDVANPTITVNNVGLKPWTATSYDLSIESYQIKNGFGSVGVFQKDIKDFFGVVSTAATPALLEQYGLENDPTLLSYDITTRNNIGDAKITGVEFSYRQSLTFLPKWARGFQVFVNATKLNLSGANTADFSGYTPKTAAGGINFVRARFAIKGTLSYIGDTNTAAVATSATIPAGTFNYQAKRTRIGLNAQYSLSKHYSLYGSVVDLGGFVQNLQRYAPNTPDYAKGMRRQELGFYTNTGIRGEF